ncbi:MAG: hypothetical protein Q9160_001018 [Pyrenula sp. 1 TL-2023]
MVRNKRKDVADEKEVHNMLEDLREFVEDGVLTKKHYKKIRYEVATQLATKQKTPHEMQKELFALEEALDILAAEMTDDEDEDEEPEYKPQPRRRESRPPQAIQYEPRHQSIQQIRSHSPQPSYSSSSSHAPPQFSRVPSQRYLPPSPTPPPPPQFQHPNAAMAYQPNQFYDRRMSMQAIPR